MAKTAEEFVMERYDLTKYDMKNEDLLRISGVDIAQDIDDYTREFAAQEVEAYKERLRSEIEFQCKDLAIDRKNTKWLLTRALTIIDAVK